MCPNPVSILLIGFFCFGIDVFSNPISRVPSFVKILHNCEQQMKSYENCIRENTNVRSKCFEQLKAVRECSAKTINAKESE